MNDEQQSYHKYSGWLWRWTGVLRKWVKRHYCVDLYTASFSYFHNIGDHFPAGFIPLDSLFNVFPTAEREFVVQCRAGNVRMMAETHEDSLKWMENINGVLNTYRKNVRPARRPRTPPTPQYMTKHAPPKLLRRPSHMTVLQTAFFRFFYSPSLTDDKNNEAILSLLLHMMLKTMSEESLSLDALRALVRADNAQQQDQCDDSDDVAGSISGDDDVAAPPAPPLLARAESAPNQNGHHASTTNHNVVESRNGVAGHGDERDRSPSPQFKLSYSVLGLDGELTAVDLKQQVRRAPRRRFSMSVNRRSNGNAIVRHHHHNNSSHNVNSNNDTLHSVVSPYDLLRKMRVSGPVVSTQPHLSPPSLEDAVRATTYRTLHRRSCPADVLRASLSQLHDKDVVDSWLNDVRHNELLMTQWALSDQGIDSVVSTVEDDTETEKCRSVGILTLFVASHLHARLLHHTERCECDDLWNGRCTIQNGSCRACHRASEAFEVLTRRCCGGRLAKLSSVTTMLSILCTPLNKRERLNVGRSVANWTVWRALLSTLRGCDFHTRRRALKDISSMLVMNGGLEQTHFNCQTLACVPQWQTLILDLLLDVPRETAFRTFNMSPTLLNNEDDDRGVSRIVERVYHYTLNMFTTVHFTSLVVHNDATSFRKLFIASLISCQAADNNDIFMVDALLTAFVMKLTSKKATLPAGYDHPMWSHVLQVLEVVQCFLLGNRRSITSRRWEALESSPPPTPSPPSRRSASIMTPSVHHASASHHHQYTHHQQLNHHHNNTNSISSNPHVGHSSSSQHKSKRKGYVTRNSPSGQLHEVIDDDDDLPPSLCGPHWQWESMHSCLKRDLTLCRRVIALLDALQLSHPRSAQSLQFYDAAERRVYDRLNNFSQFFREALVFLLVLQHEGWCLQPSEVYDLVLKFVTSSPNVRHKLFRNVDREREARRTDYLRLRRHTRA